MLPVSTRRDGQGEDVAKPDPYGWIELAIGGIYDPSLTGTPGTTSTNLEDTFTPAFPGGGYINVPMDSGLRLRVTLFNEDLINDDSIGTAEINYNDLLVAW